MRPDETHMLNEHQCFWFFYMLVSKIKKLLKTGFTKN